MFGRLVQPWKISRTKSTANCSWSSIKLVGLRDCWGVYSPNRFLLEFMITAPARHQRHVELLFMTVWYHGHRHLLGHTFPLGGPWLPQSNCDHFLVSKPYPFGPDLEICPLIERHTHILWLLPITRADENSKSAKASKPWNSVLMMRRWSIGRFGAHP